MKTLSVNNLLGIKDLTKEDLNLGFTNAILTTIQKKRSNIKDVVMQDMTKSKLPDGSYDAVVCVEVIEHVVEDAVFVKTSVQVMQSSLSRRPQDEKCEYYNQWY